jgi:hypothetical protein
MKSRYRMFAGYNAWCNGRLYAAAATVCDADYRADRGAFFKSLAEPLFHRGTGIAKRQGQDWQRRRRSTGRLGVPPDIPP